MGRKLKELDFGTSDEPQEDLQILRRGRRSQRSYADPGENGGGSHYYMHLHTSERNKTRKKKNKTRRWFYFSL